VQAAGGGQVPGVDGAHHRGVLARGHVADDADDAGRAVRQPRQVEGVVPAVEGQTGLGQNLRPREEVARRLLHRDDPRVCRQAHQRRGADPDAGPPGDVVDHHRQVSGVGDGAEVSDKPLGGGLVVVGGDDEQAVGARFGRVLGQVDAVGGVVGADAGQHSRAVADGLQDGAQQGLFLGVGGGGGLPRGPREDEAVVAVVDEMDREPPRGVEVEPAIGVERGDHRGEDGAERAGGEVWHEPTVSALFPRRRRRQPLPARQRGAKRRSRCRPLGGSGSTGIHAFHRRPAPGCYDLFL
jgi:hypothetical protein